MGEGGLGPGEVSKEIREHRERTLEGESSDGDRWVTIVEAVLLAVVAILAAYSGFASSKWGTDQSLSLARASTARVEASRANLDAMELRNFDSSTFDAWFTAYVANDASAMALAERRFRPEFDVAFQAWLASDPTNNPDAPRGPTLMPEYAQPDLEKSEELDAKADDLYAQGAEAGATSDTYVQITVYLASVLFLVGISGHFRLKAARYGLVSVGVLIMVGATVLLLTTPAPPG